MGRLWNAGRREAADGIILLNCGIKKKIFYAVYFVFCT